MRWRRPADGVERFGKQGFAGQPPLLGGVSRTQRVGPRQGGVHRDQAVCAGFKHRRRGGFEVGWREVRGDFDE